MALRLGIQAISGPNMSARRFGPSVLWFRLDHLVVAHCFMVWPSSAGRSPNYLVPPILSWAEPFGLCPMWTDRRSVHIRMGSSIPYVHAIRRIACLWRWDLRSQRYTWAGLRPAHVHVGSFASHMYMWESTIPTYVDRSSICPRTCRPKVCMFMAPDPSDPALYVASSMPRTYAGLRPAYVYGLGSKIPAHSIWDRRSQICVREVARAYFWAQNGLGSWSRAHLRFYFEIADLGPNPSDSTSAHVFGPETKEMAYERAQIRIWSLFFRMREMKPFALDLMILGKCSKIMRICSNCESSWF